MERVPHAILLRMEVTLVIGVWGDFDGHVFRDFQSVGFEADPLDRIVGQQPHLCHAEQAEDLGADAIVALVGVVAEVDVGVDRVVALLLQLIGRDFGHQPDAAAFLVEIEHHSFALFFDELHGLVQLVAAVAALAAEDVARDTGGMHTHQDGLAGLPLAFDEGYVLLAVAFLAEGDEAEVAILGGHVDFLALFDEVLITQAIGNQVADGDDVQPVRFGEGLQLGQARHRAVLVQDFDQAGRRVQSRQSGQVDGGLRVAGAGQHAFVLGIERIDVAGASECGGDAVGIGERADGGCAVVAAHAGGAPFELVHRDREGRAEHAGVLLHLMGQAEAVAGLYGDGGAKHATAVGQHEVDLFRRDQFGGGDEVAFVLAVLIVHDDDQFAVFEVLYGGFYRS